MPVKPAKRRIAVKKPIQVPQTPPVPVVDTEAPIASEVLSVPSVQADAPIELTGALAEPEESPVEAQNRWIYRAGIFVTIGIMVVSVGIWVMAHGVVQAPSAGPTPTPIVTAIPSPQAVLVVDKSAWVFDVYNGSRVPGKAGAVAGQIRALGYQVATVGNADKIRTGSVLRVRPAVSSSLVHVIQELSAVVSIGTSSADLSGTTTASAVLTIGR